MLHFYAYHFLSNEISCKHYEVLWLSLEICIDFFLFNYSRWFWHETLGSLKAAAPNQLHFHNFPLFTNWQINVYKIQTLLADMRQTYNQNRVCPYVIKSKESDDPESIKCNLAIEPGKIFFNSYNPSNEVN